MVLELFEEFADIRCDVLYICEKLVWVSSFLNNLDYFFFRRPLLHVFLELSDTTLQLINFRSKLVLVCHIFKSFFKLRLFFVLSLDLFKKLG